MEYMSKRGDCGGMQMCVGGLWSRLWVVELYEHVESDDVEMALNIENKQDAFHQECRINV